MATEAGKGFVILTLEFQKEGKYWTGFCRELGTATDGRSLQRVEAELEKLVALHLAGLEQIGDRERTFRERGIAFYTDHPPEEVSTTLRVREDGPFVRVTSVPIDSEGIALAGSR